jgi:hypothetical protein
MVVLEAAAIGAAGYGVYKGGEVGIRKTKELQKEYQRESHRSIQRGELKEKTKARQDRIAKIMSMRRGGNGNVGVGNHHNETTDTTRNPSWLATSSFSSSDQPDSNKSTTSVSSVTPLKNHNSVEDRHQAVMAKLHASRKDQAKKDQADGGSRWNKNPFAKRK